MDQLTSFLRHPTTPPKKNRRTERGDLNDYFFLELRREWDEKKYGKLRPSYIRFKLSHLKVPDLYYLKSVCEDTKRRGNSFAKCFFYQIRPEERKVV
jgi:hypothetical protein